jgi:hypothetical protein
MKSVHHFLHTIIAPPVGHELNYSITDAPEISHDCLIGGDGSTKVRAGSHLMGEGPLDFLWDDAGKTFSNTGPTSRAAMAAFLSLLHKWESEWEGIGVSDKIISAKMAEDLGGVINLLRNAMECFLSLSSHSQEFFIAELMKAEKNEEEARRKALEATRMTKYRENMLRVLESANASQLEILAHHEVGER